MIRCASCQHDEMVGALYCSECGAQLNYQELTPVTTVMYPRETGPIGASQEAAPFMPETFFTPASSPSSVVIKLLDNDLTIPLESGNEFTIGRVSGNQPILPDVDLTPYQAYEGGVSRLHATIKVAPGMISITDLGSANGTQVNGKKINAHEPHPLVHGDVITLGKFKLQIVIPK
jgi:pSer/pThr/pTyr-binding forkhead associated (FHA) protein